MRTFIILLLLTNLAYFGWNQGWLREPAPPAARTPVPVAATAAPQPFEQAPKGLTLVSELSDAERAQLLQTPPAATAQPELLNEAADAAAVPPEPVNEAIEGAAAPLASEESQEHEQNQLVGESSPLPVGPPWCAELGPFADAAAAEALVPALAALGVSAQLRSAMVPVSSTFWVYMPAFASEDEARGMLAELQERRIDSYFMRDGPFSGGISLGVFSRRGSAETVQQTLAGQGYATRIGEVFREEARNTLALRAPDAGVVKAAGWTDFMAKNTGLTLSENVCESVASPNQFP